MGFQSIRLLQLLVSCATLQYGFGFDIRMNIVPDHLDALTPSSNMTITCRSPDSFQSRKEVLVMEIGKADDTPMAMVRQNLALTVRDGLPTNMVADGRVRNNSNSNFIRLTVTNPGCQDVGEYSCLVIFLDEIGVMKEQKVKASVTMSNTASSSIIDDLKDKITSLETRAKTTEDVMDEQKNTIVELRNRVEKQSLDIEYLARNQSMLATATHEGKPPVEAFSALYDQKDTVSNGKVLVFSKIQFKEGNGYDEKTGVFIAPRKGLYVFHLTITTKRSNAMDNVEIEVNDQPQAKVLAYDIDLYAEQSSVSLALKLQKGDTVKVVFLKGATMFLNTLNTDPYYSVFTGYLLREL